MAATAAATRAKALEPNLLAAPVNSGGNEPVWLPVTPPVGRILPVPVGTTVAIR